MSGNATDPGTAVPAEGRPNLVRAFLMSPLDPRSWRATLAIGLGLFVAILAISVVGMLFSAGGSLLVWLIGVPILGLGIEASRVFARVERRRMRLVDPRPLVPHPYRPLDWSPSRPYGPWLRAWVEAQFLDPSRWLDVVYVLVLLPLAVLEFLVSFGLWVVAITLVASPLIVASLEPAVGDEVAAWIPGPADPGVAVAVVVGLLLVPVAAWTSRGLMVLHRAVAEGLLCTSPTEALRRDVARLRGSRSAALELEASELRRIERDLHDGAQQRLVALAIDLGLAEERVESDPASARQLIASAREQARQALSELRDIVRGTAPTILLDRGLEAAVAAVAAGCPVPTTLDSTLPPGERLPAAVERAAYFVVAEALTNVAKHSSATRCVVRLSRGSDRLIVAIEDDGKGGATAAPGGGLAGLRDRAEALDGSLSLSSPAGGPTVVRVELPLGGGQGLA